MSQQLQVAQGSLQCRWVTHLGARANAGHSHASRWSTKPIDFEWACLHAAPEQLAKQAGCHVIATAGGPEKVALLKQLGADRVIDYKAEKLKVGVQRWMCHTAVVTTKFTVQ